LPFICDGKRSECPDACTSDDVCASAFFCKISDNTCQPRVNGTACVDGDQCPDKNCVDGVCCETACDGQCEGCNADGKCVPVQGEPVGERAACAGHADCKGSCDGENRGECTGARVVGSACGAASCAANIGRVGACDAAGACDVSEVACHPFICGDSECKTVCEADADCQEGYACEGGDCRLSSSKCSDDGASVVDADGKSAGCDPYVCRTGSCLDSCSNSLDCQEGKVCNTDQGNGVCEAPDGRAADGDAGCGCRAAGGQRHGTGYGLVSALSLFALLRRRRRSAA
jgi:MYXO-CTERM domain-containing protein